MTSWDSFHYYGFLQLVLLYMLQPLITNEIYWYICKKVSVNDS